MSSALLPDPSELEAVAPVPAVAGPALDGGLRSRGESGAQPAVPGEVKRHLLGGTSALGLGVVIERGSGFLANILAVRLGGLATFGAYSLAITTANNIATYAAAGIGATAARFSGKYRYGTVDYRTLANVLALVSGLSAGVAAAGLWLGAAPLARLLGQPRLTGLLHWAAMSSAAIVLLECARGFFVGQRRLRALVLLSVTVGVGMLTLVPWAATHHNPVRMITSQGTIALGAVAVCLLLAGPLGLSLGRRRAAGEAAGSNADAVEEGPIETALSMEALAVARATAGASGGGVGFRAMLREVWGFGFVQLAGLVSTNAAGWWLTTLVARGDTTLVQMSFFSIASQLRNIVGLAPGLLTEGSYAVMADPEGEHLRTPEYVLGLTTFAAALFSLTLAGAGILGVPLLLHLFHTTAESAQVTTSVALALAVMHMGNAPASARLSILSIRTSGVINTVWAISVATAGTLLMLHGGSAALAMTIYLGAHTVSSGLVLGVLGRRGALPRGLVLSFGLSTGAAAALAALATLRAERPALAGPLSGAMLLLFAVAMVLLCVTGRRRGWLPRGAAVRRMLEQGLGMLRRRLPRGLHHAG